MFCHVVTNAWDLELKDKEKCQKSRTKFAQGNANLPNQWRDGQVEAERAVGLVAGEQPRGKGRGALALGVDVTFQVLRDARQPDLAVAPEPHPPLRLHLFVIVRVHKVAPLRLSQLRNELLHLLRQNH